MKKTVPTDDRENLRVDAPNRRPGFLTDESGTAMLEFVLIAPVLCYLITGMLYFRHHIDYAQDAVMRFRRLTWTHTTPDNARDASGVESDVDGFGFPLDVRTAVRFAGLIGGQNVYAWERYTNSLAGGPYDTLGLNRMNYMEDYEEMAEMPEDPWSGILGGLGTWFGTKVGGGAYEAPEGLAVGWKERTPLVVDPWQRDFSDMLDPNNYIVVGYILTFLDPFTLNRCPVPRFDLRGDIDIGQNPPFGNDENETLSMEEESGSKVWDIVK